MAEKEGKSEGTEPERREDPTDGFDQRAGATNQAGVGTVPQPPEDEDE